MGKKLTKKDKIKLKWFLLEQKVRYDLLDSPIIEDSLYDQLEVLLGQGKLAPSEIDKSRPAVTFLLDAIKDCQALGDKKQVLEWANSLIK